MGQKIIYSCGATQIDEKRPLSGILTYTLFFNEASSPSALLNSARPSEVHSHKAVLPDSHPRRLS